MSTVGRHASNGEQFAGAALQQAQGHGLSERIRVIARAARFGADQAAIRHATHQAVIRPMAELSCSYVPIVSIRSNQLAGMNAIRPIATSGYGGGSNALRPR